MKVRHFVKNAHPEHIQNLAQPRVLNVLLDIILQMVLVFVKNVQLVNIRAQAQKLAYRALKEKHLNLGLHIAYDYKK